MFTINKQVFYTSYAKYFQRDVTQNNKKNLDSLLDLLTASQAAIDNPLLKRCAYLLATVFHETGGSFSPALVENMNYTTPQRIMAVWPSRFMSVAQALPYVRNPAGLANKVYGGRYGNGMANGDGYLYRGRGYTQITFKDVYAKFGTILKYDLVSQPELACDPGVSGKIIILGMTQGLFTGKKLADYINTANCDYYNARRIINVDMSLNAMRISTYASNFEKCLVDSAYVTSSTPLPVANYTLPTLQEVKDKVIDIIKALSPKE